MQTSYRSLYNLFNSESKANEQSLNSVFIVACTRMKLSSDKQLKGNASPVLGVRSSIRTCKIPTPQNQVRIEASAIFRMATGYNRPTHLNSSMAKTILKTTAPLPAPSPRERSKQARER